MEILKSGTFNDLLGQTPTEESFRRLITDLMTPDLRALLGEKAETITEEAAFYLTSLAPAPASFDLQALHRIGYPEGQLDQAEALARFFVDIGLLKAVKTSTSAAPRYAMEEETREKLRSLLT